VACYRYSLFDEEISAVYRCPQNAGAAAYHPISSRTPISGGKHFPNSRIMKVLKTDNKTFSNDNEVIDNDKRNAVEVR